MYEAFHKYVYEGPVKEFDNVISNHWTGETMAPSEKKARANLVYQYKKRTNRIAATKISLPGKIKMVG